MDLETKNDLRIGEKSLHDEEKGIVGEAAVVATPTKVSICTLVENERSH
jgi:hypothetical protein